MKKVMMVLVAVLAVMAGSTVYAGNQSAPMVASKTHSYEKGMIGSVPYLTGGVGENERATIEPLERNYNLKLVFAARSGAYLATPMVRIEDMNGKEILHMRSDGPWFLAKLPSGEYKVVVSRTGHQTEIQNVKVGEGLQTTEFLWKS